MARRRHRFQFDAREIVLERRELLSHGGFVGPAGHGAVPAGVPVLQPSNFHHDYIRVLNSRKDHSGTTALQINNAFQAFVQNYLGIPVADQASAGSSSSSGSGGSGSSGGAVPVGTVPMPPTLANFIAQLDQQVTQALTTIILTTNRVQPSVQSGPKFSPRALTTIVPYAQAQIAELGQTLAAQPPTFDSHGKLTSPASMDAVNKAFNAILNAVAEESVHPQLFRSPSDFYINPRAVFKIPFTGTPAQQGPDFYLRGAHGIPLPNVLGRLRV